MNMGRFVCLCMAVLAVSVGGCLTPLANIYLDESANGSTVTASVSTLIVVMLASNASTGYQWELAQLDTSVLENTADTYLPPAIAIPGAPGSERWEFVARAAGTTTLRLEYRRPWETQELDPADTFEVTVTVSAPES
ncbi:MAG TPA: protease inhibitor I42 family protein [Phycisphaerae bacterium]|nr:protease inhibitor I42 family protein [Phycisphaerae bacterium]